MDTAEADDCMFVKVVIFREDVKAKSSLDVFQYGNIDVRMMLLTITVKVFMPGVR